MQQILHQSTVRNGNGALAVGGRGARRRKLTPEQRVGLAADIALGLTPFAPSIGQTAAATGVSPYSIRKELKARAAAAERERQAESGALPIINAWVHATPQGRAEAIQIIGRGEVWDSLASTL